MMIRSNGGRNIFPQSKESKEKFIGTGKKGRALATFGEKGFFSMGNIASEGDERVRNGGKVA